MKELTDIYVDFRSRKPIYEQLVDNISSLVMRGILQPDEPIPSVRQLASELGINPNTIHKAFAELEKRGIIYSVVGRGSFVNYTVTDAVEQKQSELLARISSPAKEAHGIGTPLDEVIKAATDGWTSGEDPNEIIPAGSARAPIDRKTRRSSRKGGESSND